MKNKFFIIVLFLFIMISLININPSRAESINCDSYNVTLSLLGELENEMWDNPKEISVNAFNNAGNCYAEIPLGTSTSFYVSSSDKQYKATDLVYSNGVVGNSIFNPNGRFLLVTNITSSMKITANIPGNSFAWVTNYNLTVEIKNTSQGLKTFNGSTTVGAITLKLGNQYFKNSNNKDVILNANDFTCIDINGVVIDKEYSVGNHSLSINRATGDVFCNADLIDNATSYIRFRLTNGKFILDNGLGIKQEEIGLEVINENQPEIEIEIEIDAIEEDELDPDNGSVVCQEGSKISYKNRKLSFEEIKPNDNCTIIVDEINEENTCFSGSNNLYSGLKNNTVSIDEFKSSCCSLKEAKSEMGNADYDKYCLDLKCKKDVLDAKCTNEPDRGHIYQAIESGVTNNNFACVISGVDDQTSKSFEIANTIGNPYCNIYCKEDVDFKYPGYGYNERTKHSIQSGNYFVFKQYPDNLTKQNLLPSIKQKRSCVYKQNIGKFTYDVYGEVYDLEYLNSLETKEYSGWYKEAYDYLIEYYNTLKSGTDNQELYKSYQNTVKKINNAIAKLNECNIYKNNYYESDYPKIDNFYYDEMKNPKGINKDIISSIKLVENVKVVKNPTTKDYCNYTNSLECNKKSVSINLPTLSLEPVGYGLNKQKFIKENKIAVKDIQFFNYAIDDASVEINYDFKDDFYAIKPSGNVTTYSQIPITNKNNNSYLFLGKVLPIDLVTMAGKYNYSFDITNLGKNNIMLDVYKLSFTTNKRSCSYYVGNSIFCTKKGCVYLDGETCKPENLCEDLKLTTIDDPRLMVVSRRVDLNNINPGKKTLDSNWGSEKGLLAQNRITSIGESIYLEKPMYSFTLTSKDISAIKQYNKSNPYLDFNLKCNNDGNRCQSNFVKKYEDNDSNHSYWIEYDEENKKFDLKY